MTSALVGCGEELLESVARWSRFSPGWKSLETLLRDELVESDLVADWLFLGLLWWLPMAARTMVADGGSWQ